jgi:effector-binding domain-containing protein/ribosome-associated toxin RatA of RatAB toxin-antitoxin module
MRAFKRLLVILLVLVVAFSLYVATRPGSFSFERSRTIKAPVSVLFNKVNDFKNWPEFSPWLERDAFAQLSFRDHTTGEGAGYGWQGDIIGEGHMETTAVTKNSSITQRINFIKPFEAQSDVRWEFREQGDSTRVSWQMSGKQNFISKLFTLFMGSIEEMTGPDFERGLYKLDSIVQSDMSVYKIDVNGVVDHSGSYYLYKSSSCKFSEFQSEMQRMMPEIKAYALSNNIRTAGQAFVIYHKWDEANDAIIFSTCIPTTTRILASEPDILTGELAPFRSVKTTLTGHYDNLKEAWDVTIRYAREQQLQLLESGSMIEAYVLEASTNPNPAEWVTEIYAAIE